MDKGFFLDIKGKNLSGIPAQARKKQSIVAVSHGGVDAEISRLNLLLDKLGAPLGDRIIFHEY